jgi:hypothetical protein
MVDQYMRHCMSHPHHAKLASHYAMPPAAPAAAEPELDGPEPTEDPSADVDSAAAMPPQDEEEEMPEQHSAAASATNGTLPVATPRAGKPAQHSRVARNADLVREAQMRRELDDLKRRLDQAEEQKRRAEGERLVTQLVAEGYEMDEEAEVLRFARLDESDRSKHADYIRSYHRHATIGSVAPVLDRGERFSMPEEGEVTNDAHLARAVQYCREHPNVGWVEAVGKTKR